MVVNQASHVLPRSPGSQKVLGQACSIHFWWVWGPKTEILTPTAKRPKNFKKSIFSNRSQLFLRERNWTENVDLDLICDCIKNTEFPVPKNRLLENNDTKTIELSNLVMSADLIGQLADPGYYRKIPALYYEFEETGANLRLGYGGPADLKKS